MKKSVLYVVIPCYNEENNIKKEIRDFKHLPDCFIKKNDRYNPNVKKLNLPVIPIKYLYVLEKWGIEFELYQIEKKGEVLEYCRYWDKRHYEEQEVELPVYEFKHASGVFRYIGKHKGKLPTKRSVDAAYRLKEKVDEDILEKRTQEKIGYLRYRMAGRAAAYFDTSEFKSPFEEGDLENFCIFILKKDDKSNHMIVFDYNRIYDGDVILDIPREYVDEIVGEDSENAERWFDVLRLNSAEQQLVIQTY